MAETDRHILEEDNFILHELEKMDVYQLKQIVLTRFRNKGIFPKGVYRIKTFEDEEKWEKEHLIKFLFSQQHHIIP